MANTIGKLEALVDKMYLNTPTKFAIIDHEKKRRYVLHKDGLPDVGDYYLLMHFKFVLFFIFSKSKNMHNLRMFERQRMRRIEWKIVRVINCLGMGFTIHNEEHVVPNL
ncbi:hypothetical protein S245_048324, partial [Arachis hypogaea]